MHSMHTAFLQGNPNYYSNFTSGLTHLGGMDEKSVEEYCWPRITTTNLRLISFHVCLLQIGLSSPSQISRQTLVLLCRTMVLLCCHLAICAF